MKKTFFVFILAALCVFVLTGCQCEHEFLDADCLSPKTCELCGETEGEALGHDWQDASCIVPQTCSRCGLTEGETTDHSWQDASCTAPKTCSVCALTEGETLEHTWVEATTSAPKTCSVCNATEGERIITDDRFTTEACAQLFGSWTSHMETAANLLGYSDTDEIIGYTITYFFGNDGQLLQETVMDDPEHVEAIVLDYMKRIMYAQFADQGYTEAQVDAAFIMETGVTLDEYFKGTIAQMQLSETQYYDLVYYVSGDSIFVSSAWDQGMTSFGLTMDGDTMTLTYEDGRTEVYRRVVE